MPTVINPDLAEGFSIRVLTRNEHNPAHVHVFKNGGEIRVKINGKHAVFWDVKKAMGTADVLRAVELVEQHLNACKATWETYNGHL